MILDGYRVLPGMPDMRLPHAAYRGLYGLHGLGDTPADAVSTEWYDNIPQWIQQIQTAVNTQRLLDLNIQRAQQGLAPINAQSVAPTLNFGLSPQTQQLLIYGAIAFAVLTLIKKA